MGILDILNGMQNGPRGASRAGEGGMSPLTMAMLALLAYKAFKSFSGSAAGAPGGAPAPGPIPSGPPAQLPSGAAREMPGSSSAGGGLLTSLDEYVRRGGAGSGTSAGAGGGLGGLITGGLEDLLKQFQGAGQADVARSWVGTGQNQPISPQALSQVFDPEQLDFLARQSGLSREELLAGLSEQLPGVVDGLTPDGRLPTAEEMKRFT